MDNEEIEAQPLDVVCPQTAASVVVPSKTMLCVVFLVDHTVVSVSSLFVDTMKIIQSVCSLFRNYEWAKQNRVVRAFFV